MPTLSGDDVMTLSGSPGPRQSDQKPSKPSDQHIESKKDIADAARGRPTTDDPIEIGRIDPDSLNLNDDELEDIANAVLANASKDVARLHVDAGNEVVLKSLLKAAMREVAARRAGFGHAARTPYADPVSGFKSRRAAHRATFKKNHMRRPVPASHEDYTVVDFVREEWGDLLKNQTLSTSILIEHDFHLYRALNDFVRGIRNGSFYREPEPDLSLPTLLSRLQSPHP